MTDNPDRIVGVGMAFVAGALVALWLAGLL